MAEEAIELDAAAQSGGMMKKLVYAGVGAALLGAGVFGGMVLVGDDPPAAGEEEVAEITAADGPALYQSLHPRWWSTSRTVSANRTSCK